MLYCRGLQLARIQTHVPNKHSDFASVDLFYCEKKLTVTPLPILGDVTIKSTLGSESNKYGIVRVNISVHMLVYSLLHPHLIR